MTRFSVLTLFPESIEAYFKTSIPGRALQKGLFELQLIQIRDFAVNSYGKVDDSLYGGGTGMLLMAEPLAAAIDQARHLYRTEHPEVTDCRERLLYLSPRGQRFSQQSAQQWAELDHVILLCGHYEGVDQRLLDAYQVEEISLGDFVLTGGEIAAVAMIDAACRLIPGVLPNEEAFTQESFQANLLEGAQYTRPEVWRDRAVPAVLKSGHAEQIRQYRRQSALYYTYKLRPDLLSGAELGKDDWSELLKQIELDSAASSEL